jgi:predicted RND superfamily exporter protein
MVSEDGLRFVLFPGPHTAGDVALWLEAARAAPEIRTLSGTPVLFDQLSRAIVRAQTVSLALAFALVAALLLITYRRLSTALLALLPLALGVATMLAFLAASGIHLNLITAVASSIVIGVGIDYAIHLIAAMEHARRERPGEDGWVRRALATAGRPIVANAIGVPTGLTALLISPLAPHAHISMLMWVAMLTSALAALVVIPARARGADRVIACRQAGTSHRRGPEVRWPRSSAPSSGSRPASPSRCRAKRASARRTRSTSP